MKSIKVVRPLKSSQALREEASQPMLAQAKGEWKPPAKSGWGALPEPAKLPGPTPEPPAAPVAYSVPEVDAATTGANTRQKYVTGSRLAATKMPLPKGVYVVETLTVISLVLSMFRIAESGVSFTIVMFFDLVAAVGLLLQLEFFRKLFVLLSAAVIVYAGIALFTGASMTTVSLAGLLVTVGASVIQIVYVTRPKVRAAFETLKT
jgi:hypothetical protein